MRAASAVATLDLPSSNGPEPVRYTVNAPRTWCQPMSPITSRKVFAAAHVVPDVLSDTTVGSPAVIDWDSTLAYRHAIWAYGLGVADAMDTAQRGMGMDWAATRELIVRSGREARAAGGELACGAGTDQLDDRNLGTGSVALAKIVDAYKEQIDVITEAGAQTIVMASRLLARVAQTPQDYASVYDQVIDYAPDGVILHWLGVAFDASLAGYWGSADVERATAHFEDILGRHATKIDGVKVSLLDAAHETGLRDRLPGSVRLYTGDDFNYPELIIGDGARHSDALLGIFAAIYPAASEALQALDRDDEKTATEILVSTQALSRHIFAAPTQFYKTGIAFLSYLNGQQPGFVMVGGLHSGRSLRHLVRIFELADGAGLLCDPELAVRRMRVVLEVAGWTEPSR